MKSHEDAQREAKRRRWPAWALEEFEERAAIMEYDGKLRRDDAEREAHDLVAAKGRARRDAGVEVTP